MSFLTVDELKTFKKCTGGDSIFAEYKGKNGFEFVFGGLFWFCMNRNRALVVMMANGFITVLFKWNVTM